MGDKTSRIISGIVKLVDLNIHIIFIGLHLYFCLKMLYYFVIFFNAYKIEHKK